MCVESWEFTLTTVSMVALAYAGRTRWNKCEADFNSGGGCLAMESSMGLGWHRSHTCQFHSLRKRTHCASNNPKRDATQNQTNVPLLSKFSTTCPRSSKVAGWPDRHGQTPVVRISLAQQCMPSPTVEQIRRANEWVRRAHQFAELTLTFFVHSTEKLYTDYSSKDQDGTGRTQG